MVAWKVGSLVGRTAAWRAETLVVLRVEIMGDLMVD